VLSGISIGFQIPPGSAVKMTADDGYPALDIIRSKLFEVPVLPVGDNPDAVVRVVEKGLGGLKLMPEFHAMLRMFVNPSRSTTVRGSYVREKQLAEASTSAAEEAPPAEALPTEEPKLPPSAQFLSDLNMYASGSSSSSKTPRPRRSTQLPKR
jgi:hypothetical protein